MAFQSPANQWAVSATAAANTAVICTKAALAAVQHVIRRMIATVAQGAAAQTPIAIVLRDGATGAGTILCAWEVSAIAAGGLVVIDADNLYLVGTLNTAMTVDVAAPAANSIATANMIGYDLP